MGVDPDDAEPVVPRGEPFDRADVRAAAAAEDERPHAAGRRRPRASARGACPPRRPPPRDSRAASARRLDHRLAAVAPRPRHAHEPGRERAAARVALVVRPDRDGRERPAVGHFARRRLMRAPSRRPRRTPRRTSRRARRAASAPVGFSASTPSVTRVMPRRRTRRTSAGAAPWPVPCRATAGRTPIAPT